jgi:hypothetical protein
MNLTGLLRGLKAGGIGGVITGLHQAEDDLALALIDLSDRHASDHEVHFVARDLAGWSREHVRRLAEAGRAHGLELDPEPSSEHAWPAVLKRAAGETLGRLHSPSLLLLGDLRDVHRAAAGVSLDWEVVAQAAQASEDGALAELVAACHPQTLRQLRWTNAQVKELSAQAVAAI